MRALDHFVTMCALVHFGDEIPIGTTVEELKKREWCTQEWLDDLAQVGKIGDLHVPAEATGAKRRGAGSAIHIVDEDEVDEDTDGDATALEDKAGEPIKLTRGAKKLVAEHGIEDEQLREIEGSGRGGSITANDLEPLIEG